MSARSVKHQVAAEIATQQRSLSKEAGEKTSLKRYNLVLPSSLFDEIQTQAKSENISVLELLKRFIKIGLVLTKITRSPDASLIVRQGDRERELVLL